jgi:penicillin-binding protein 1A
MTNQPTNQFKIRGRKVFGKVVFTFLLVCSILFGVVAGLLFVYSTDLPEVRALEDYHPNLVTELYADDGTPVGSFALQRRILLSYEQIPPVLRDAVLSAEDQHFFEHWGVDLPRVLQAGWRDLTRGRLAEGASTLTMQLAGLLFLDRSDRSLKRKIGITQSNKFSRCIAIRFISGTVSTEWKRPPNSILENLLEN